MIVLVFAEEEAQPAGHSTIRKLAPLFVISEGSDKRENCHDQEEKTPAGDPDRVQGRKTSNKRDRA
jgi:hypothetical protein